MSALLSVVEDVFDISHRGVVVAPGVPRDTPWVVLIGERLMVRRPDGSELSTVVRGIEMFSPPSPKGWGILLEGDISKAMVPVGSELWLIEPRRPTGTR